MFNPGIKIGPQYDWRERLEESGAQHCEVWFNVADEKKYANMFSYLKENRIRTGLHFWAVLDDNVMANLAYPDEHIWKASMDRMKHTLDTASRNRFSYVNIHLGNAALERIDFVKHATSHVENSQVDRRSAESTFTRNIAELHAYAQRAGVMLVVETIPPKDPEQQQTKKGRLNPHSTYALSNTYLENIAKKLHVNVNNDISHTAAEFGETTDRDLLWKYLLDRTNAMLPHTAVVHLNTMSEPFNGTDSHDGILDTDFATNVFPNKQQVVELLKRFATRNTVWVINEPSSDHVENYRRLVALKAQMGG